MTNNIMKRFEKEIIETEIKNIDEAHVAFLNSEADFSIEEIVFTKKIFDFLKARLQ